MNRWVLALFFLLGCSSPPEKKVAIFANYAVSKEHMQSLLPNCQVESYFPIPSIEKKHLTGYQKIERALFGKHLIPLSQYGERILFFNCTSNPVKIFSQRNLKKEHLVLFMWEPPTVLPHMHTYAQFFGKVYTWNDDLVDNKHYFKLYYPCLRPLCQEIPSYEEKKLCTLIATQLTSTYPGELYSARREAVAFFASKPLEEFALFGKGWEGLSPHWKGPIQDKIEVLKNYRFSLCFENTKDCKGYITEKIFDCFAAGVVPVYWGAPNVDTYIPKECFIDMCAFSSYEELYTFLKNMSKETYQHYLLAIQTFLTSEEAKLFSWENFAHTLEAVTR